MTQPRAATPSDANTWRTETSTLSVYESVARLYGPADVSMPAQYVEAGDAWALDDLERAKEAVAVIWGNVPANGRALPVMLRWAVSRELALRAIGRRYAAAIRGVHRLPPPTHAAAGPSQLRTPLLSGLLVELGTTGTHRVLDAVVNAAGADADSAIAPRPSRDGSALVRLVTGDGVPFELRVCMLGGRKDPGRNADALQVLESARTPLVPRLRGRGVTAGASWTAETVLPGRRPRRLDRRLSAAAAAFAARLPRSAAPEALPRRMRRLGERYPRWSPITNQLATRPLPWQGILQHGDYWLGNLLVANGSLAGVIDWDTWDHAGMPGVDLLQLVAMERRRRTGDDIGALWLGGIWRSPEFLALGASYWRELRIDVTDDLLEVVGLDWWAGQVFKRQSFATRPGWPERNVEAVLAAVDGSR